MKKIFLVFLLVSGGLALEAAPLPDNMYFRAMKDEMDRSLKELRVKNGPKPFYLAYQLENFSALCESASFGKLDDREAQPYQRLRGQAVLAAGSPQNDSMGFTEDQSRYAPVGQSAVPQSYWGIRHGLWQLTDHGYLNASEMYEKKQAYKRQKNITNNWPDFASAPQGSFVEEIPPFSALPREEMQAWAKTLSAQGEGVSYLEDFSASLCMIQRDFYYLNSNGGFYQYAQPSRYVILFAQMRNQAGYRESLRREIQLPQDWQAEKQNVQQQTAQLLQEAAQLYQAQKAEPYLGPVLLTPSAAADFINRLLVKNVRNVKPLLSSQRENDPTAGAFRDKTGMRVMSNVVDVYDKPLQREYNGVPLAGFMPVDDEGVQAQDLTVVSGGKLHQLPLSRRSASQRQPSNGHARMNGYTLPREALTNVFVQAKAPLTQQEMEDKLLARCRELELDYCYILKEFPSGRRGTDNVVNVAERIYTKDGRREPVFGLKISELSTRSLRDILAAGDDARLSFTQDPEFRDYSLVVPSLLVDEIEILPSDKKADRKPFVPKP